MFRSILQIYVKGSDEAFEFYKKAFDAKIGFQDIDEKGTVIHRELDVCGQAIAVGEARNTTRAGGDKRITQYHAILYSIWRRTRGYGT